MGVGLAAFTGAIAGFQKLQWLLKETPYIYPLIPEAVKRLVKGTKMTSEKTTGWLVDHWPFVEKGFSIFALQIRYNTRVTRALHISANIEDEEAKGTAKNGWKTLEKTKLKDIHRKQ